MTTAILELGDILHHPTPAGTHHEPLSEGWATCYDGAWMLAVATELSGPAWGDGRRPLVLAACEIASLAFPAFRRRYRDDNRPRVAIRLARRWASGDKSVTPDDVARASEGVLDALRMARDYSAASNPQDERAKGAAFAAFFAIYAVHQEEPSCSVDFLAAGLQSIRRLRYADIIREHFPDLFSLMLHCDRAEVRQLAVLNLGEMSAPPDHHAPSGVEHCVRRPTATNSPRALDGGAYRADAL